MPDSNTSPYDLSLALLRREHPRQYALWVFTGVLVGTLAYLASCVLIVVEQGWGPLWITGNPYVALTGVAALALVRAGRGPLAGGAMLFAIWVENHVAVLTHGPSYLGTGGTLMPVLIMGTALLVGGRAAFAMAATTAVSLPVSMLIGQRLHPDGSPGLDAMFLLTLEGSVAATALMLGAFLYSFSRILRQQHEAQRRSQQLQEQLQQAQKLEAVGLLAGGIAHDFNNLLTAIGGFGSLVARSADPKMRSHGQEIVSAQKRGAALVRQLLAFARKDVARPRPIDLGQSLRSLQPLVQRLVGDGVEVTLQTHGSCAVVIDPGRFEQVVMNLAANARDALEGHGQLRIECRSEGDRVLLDFQDDGPGIPDAARARIFEPFFTTKDHSKGTGLGLSTVHGIVVDSEGEITVGGPDPATSRQDDAALGGARFRLSWPASPLLPDTSSSSQTIGAVTGRGLRLLLVDDDDPTRNYLTELLGGHGYEIDVAANAEAALRISESLPAAPHLLLTDVVMPGLSGPELAERLRERWPGLPVLFMSGYLGDLDDYPGLDPVRDLIAKPFSGTELLERLAQQLSPAPAP